MSERMTDAEVADLIIPLVGRHGYADVLSRKSHAEITTLRVENDALAKSCAAAAENNETLRAEVERLKTALRVYAGPVGGDSFPHWSDGYPGGVMVEWNTIDFGDAARAALGDTP